MPASSMEQTRKPVCGICGRRVERIGMDAWAHLTTVAGIEAEKDHPAVLRRDS